MEREQNWLKKRLGVISASEVHHLFSTSKKTPVRADDKWLEGSVTYLYKKQYERTYNEMLCPVSSRAMSIGLENEKYAVEWLRTHYFDLIIKHCSEDFEEIVFVENGKGLGGSPDCLIMEGDKTIGIIEIKCVVGEKNICRYFSPTLAYDKKRIDAFEEHKFQLAAQLLLYPEVGEIKLLKYLPQLDENPMDTRSVLDEARGVVFTYTRADLQYLMEQIEKRVSFADNYLREGLDLEELN